MEQKKLRIGELAQHLHVEQFVIRYWEKEFGIKPRRSSGGQRYYTQKDVKKFETIRQLLHDKKFTIAGARQVFDYLSKHKTYDLAFTASELTSLPIARNETQSHIIYEQLRSMREQLYNVKHILDNMQCDIE